MVTFLTGATGFLGAHLLRDLLSRGRRVVALVRPREGESSADRLDLLLTLVGAPDDIRARLRTDVRCVDGDVRMERFGLSEGEYRRLTGETEELWHCAASITLRGDSLVPWESNVGGINQVLRFIDNCPIPVRFFPISTVYVAGVMREGELPEEFPAATTRFENAYEKSKDRMERIVHDWSRRTGRVAVVFRTSILISDRSGVEDFPEHTLLAVARRLRALLGVVSDEDGRWSRWPLDPLATINMVPADHAVQVMLAMAETLEWTPANRAVHIVNPKDTPIHAMRTALEESCDVRIRAVPGYPALATPAEYGLYRLIGPFFPYFNHRRTYSDETVRLARLPVPDCPVVDESYMMRGLAALRNSAPEHYGLVAAAR